MFDGTYTALVTPFRNDAFDFHAYDRLIEAQIKGGVKGIVPVGTTGESPTLSHGEHIEVIRHAVDAASQYTPHGRKTYVIAGTGSNSTAEAVSLTKEAKDAGADATLHVAPYYNKPSQEGLFRHFAKVAEATELPVVLYSIPGRCGVEIAVETVVRLAGDFPARVVAIKEAGGSVERVSALRAALPPEFDILSGDDSLTLPFLAAGAVGVISVASNLVPGVIVSMVNAALGGDFTAARKIHAKYYRLFKDLFIEPNPVPIKKALALVGALALPADQAIQPDVRLPLCEMTEPNAARLEDTLRYLGILK